MSSFIELKNILNNCEHNMSNSPILRNKNIIFTKDKEQAERIVQALMEIRSNLKRQIEKLDEPLNIVFIGEVNCGKSTLVNALIGKEVSQVDVLEATASINIIKFSDNEEVIIVKTGDEQQIKLNFENAIKLLKEHQNDQEFFKSISYVIFHLNLPELRDMHIVDTPGIATMTAQNREKTLDFVSESDLVIWVLNANYLGQQDIDMIISDVKKKGKQMICVITKIDEINDSVDRLIEYTQQSYGIYFDKIFAVSGINGLKAIKSNDIKLLEESRFDKLQNFIFKEVVPNKKQYLFNAVKDSSIAIIGKDMLTHFEQNEILKHNIETYSEEVKRVEEFADEIYDDMMIMIDHKIKNELFQDEVKQIIQEIKSLSFLDTVTGKSKLAAIEERYNKIFDKKKIEETFKELVFEVENELKKKWEIKQFLLREQLEKRNLIFENKLNEYEKKIEFEDMKVTDGLLKSVSIAGAAGVSLAFYEAAIGPYAAYITMGSALGAIMPPVLLMGGAVGVVLGAFSIGKFKQEKDKLIKQLNEVDSDIDKLYNNIKSELGKTIKENNDKIIETNNKKLVEIFLKNKDINEIQEIIDYHDKYISDLEKHLDHLKNIRFPK